jgi:formylglycine-generating enzyme
MAIVRAHILAAAATGLTLWIVGCTLGTHGTSESPTDDGGTGGFAAAEAGEDHSLAGGKGGQSAAGGQAGSAGMDASGGSGAKDSGVEDQSAGSGGTAGAGGTSEGGAGQGGVAGSAGTGGPEAGAPTCPVNLPGPAMTLIRYPAGGLDGYYCIDSTEVTALQYKAWLSTAATPSNDVVCAWNLTYAPEALGKCNLSIHGNATAHPQWPMVCVDWCDARDYCAWAGKRLCGKIGGGPVGFDAAIDPVASEWANACMGGGFHLYPYGDTLEQARCVDDYFDGTKGNGVLASPEDVGSATQCTVKEYPSLLDMFGNVWEWTDSC